MTTLQPSQTNTCIKKDISMKGIVTIASLPTLILNLQARSADHLSQTLFTATEQEYTSTLKGRVYTRQAKHLPTLGMTPADIIHRFNQNNQLTTDLLSLSLPMNQYVFKESTVAYSHPFATSLRSREYSLTPQEDLPRLLAEYK